MLSGYVGTVENNVTLYRDERWTSDINLTISGQEVQMAGGEKVLDQLLQQTLAQQRKQAEALAVRVSQSKSNGADSSVVYSLHSEGQKIDSLNRVVFGGSSLSKDDQGGETRLAFSYYPMGMRFYSLRLTVGKVASSNADRVSGKTLIWANLVQSGGARAELVWPVAHPSTDLSVELFKGNLWRAETRLIVSKDDLAAIDDQSAVDAQIRQAQQPILDRELTLNMLQRQERSADGSAVYVIVTSGQGLDLLNQQAFDGLAEIRTAGQAGQPAIHFTYKSANQSKQPTSPKAARVTSVGRKC